MSAMTLLPCPFCGTSMTSDDEDGCYQKSGFIGAQTPVWLVTCFNTSCNASVDAASREAAIKAWNRRANLAQPTQAVDVWDEHDRIEFALRDAGFDLDRASEIATRAITGEKAGPVDGRRLRALVQSWRERESRDRMASGEYYSGKAHSYEICADELESELPASPSPDKEG